MSNLKAPFPYFGGKSAIAHEVWARFGDVANYVEPFAGSLAVLLSRPSLPRIETVNDLNGYLTCFWRSIQHDPIKTAEWASSPVSECDLIARHSWLRAQRDELTERMKTDPDYYDPKVAGWWVWGAACWIGSGWCESESRKLPHLGDAGRGVTKKLPHLGDAGRGPSRDGLEEWFVSLQNRLLRVRIACGDWSRVLGPSVTFKHGMTGVFLDPPYSTDLCSDVYRTGSITKEIEEWVKANQANSELRICLAGYEGEYDLPGWNCLAWKANGGMSKNGTRAYANANKERLWFSPACLSVGLFDDAA